MANCILALLRGKAHKIKPVSDFLLIRKGKNFKLKSTIQVKLVSSSAWNRDRSTLAGSARFTGCCWPALRKTQSMSGCLAVTLDNVSGSIVLIASANWDWTTYSATKASMPCLLLMSKLIAAAFSGPCLRTKSSSLSCLRPTAMTLLPSSTSRSPRAAPMPDVAPTIRTERYLKGIMTDERAC